MAISVKNRKIFPPPCILRPAQGVPLEIGYQHWGQNTRMMGLLGRQRRLMISLAVWIQCANVTDGRIDTERQKIPCLRIASHS